MVNEKWLFELRPARAGVGRHADAVLAARPIV
jgi:hypothetical protein